MTVSGSKEIKTVSNMLNKVTSVTRREQYSPVTLSNSFITGTNICLPKMTALKISMGWPCDLWNAAKKNQSHNFRVTGSN